MRVLAEQTYSAAEGFLRRLELSATFSSAGNPGQVSLHLLMGGEQDDAIALSPDQDAIVIGTQDLLLSRALNRGYGLSRFRWPMAFGLFNNDCLWVLDEVQLMGVGLNTSAQLDGLRRKLGVIGQCSSLWMSATLQPAWLETPDHHVPNPEQILALEAEDTAEPRLAQRLQAPKRLKALPLSSTTGDLVTCIRKEHRPGTLTLVVVNTVERAKAVYGALITPAGTGRRRSIEQSQSQDVEVLLVHSHFRPVERRELNARLVAPLPSNGMGRIVVATQVVEAGIDVSAATLFTELAPWASLVQRFGRCNRDGKDVDGRVFWIDVDEAKQSAPYDPQDLRSSRLLLQSLEGASVAPADLPDAEFEHRQHQCIRRSDLIGIFDTLPDLSGNDVDVSGFIREDDELDAQVFWRLVDDPGRSLPDVNPPRREELCTAPLSQLRRYVETGAQPHSSPSRSAAGGPAWVWDHLLGEWRPVRRGDIRAGQVYLLRCADGGYTVNRGWDLSSTADVVPFGLSGSGLAQEAVGSDVPTFGASEWLTIAEHTDAVVNRVHELTAALGSDLVGPSFAAALQKAARFHDAGKAHPVFQQTLLSSVPAAERELRSKHPWAKAAIRGARHSRPHFRHELASALALRQNRQLLSEGAQEEVGALAAFLVAAHHGRVRLAIRSLPDETKPPDDRRYALGVWDGDTLPEVDLGSEVILPETALDLSQTEIGVGTDGEPSWLESALSMRDAQSLGPFRLAYLEGVLRAADSQVSAALQSESRSAATGEATQ